MRAKVLLTLCLIVIIAMAASGCSGAVGDRGSGDGLHKTAPDVVGLSQSEASQRIVDAGYEVGSVAQESRPNEDEGTVIRQEPVAGTSVARGGEINLVVAE